LTPTPDASATLDLTPTATADLSLTPNAPLLPVFKMGDTIAVRTGVILDYNKHPVPDGTVVRFVLLLSKGDGGLTRQVEAITTDGMAAASFSLDQPGIITIQASSQAARNSNTIQLNVNSEGATPVIIVPATAVIVVTPTATLSTPSSIGPKTGSVLTTAEGYPTFLGWFLALLLIASGVALTYWFGVQFAEPRWAVRWALLVLLGGLAAYNYLILEMPGSVAWLEGRGLSAFLQAILFGQGSGFAVGWFWRLMTERPKQAQE
jgi:beta-N-acetylhexosaminidase